MNYKKRLFCWTLLLLTSIGSLSFADSSEVSAKANDEFKIIGWDGRGKTPMKILDSVAGEANKNDGYDVQDTKFNKVHSQWNKLYTVYGTLEWFRINIQPYLQWIIYISLVGATILIIWNGFLLVSNSALQMGEIKTIQDNMKNIAIGVLIMTGFLVIIKIVTAVLNTLFTN